jgi:RNA polymerase sigma-70 factor (ECF subfamily)
MASQDIEPTAPTPAEDMAGATEFEGSLIKLMPGLRAFARAISRNADLADDLVQETLAKAWRSRGSFTAGSNLKAWLRAILRNEFFSHHRTAWRRTLFDPQLMETLVAPPEEQESAAELSDTVCAMRGLPDGQREALMLVGVGGLSYDDVSTLLRRPIGTVKSRVGRARQSLKEILNGRRALPIESRPANGNAMKELLAQLTVSIERTPKNSKSGRG